MSSSRPVDDSGIAKVAIAAQSLPLTAFGEIAVAQKHPELQYTFPTHLDPTEWKVRVNGTNGMVHTSNDVLSVSTSTDTDGEVKLSSRAFAHYYTGQGLILQFSLAAPPITAGHTWLFGIGDDADALGVGSDGSNFSFIRRKDGTPNYVARSAWDDPMDGTGPSKAIIDIEMGNVWFIRVMWHGMGNLMLYCLDPSRLIPTLVHTIKFANTEAGNTSFGNPGLPVLIESIKTSGATNLVIKTASMAVFSEGIQRLGAIRRATHVDNESVAENTETCLMTLRNRETVLGGTSHGTMVVNRIAVSNEGSRTHLYRVYKNAHVDSTSYSTVHTCSSIAEYDTSASTVNEVETGTAQATEATTITLAADASATDDYYNGRMLVITSATAGTHQCREILDYDGSTKKATVVKWHTTPTGTVQYTIENGIEVGAITTAKDSAHVDDLTEHTSYHLSPGESLTITVISAAATKARVSFAWNELL